VPKDIGDFCQDIPHRERSWHVARHMRGNEQSEGARKSSISGSRPMFISLHSYDTL